MQLEQYGYIGIIHYIQRYIALYSLVEGGVDKSHSEEHTDKDEREDWQKVDGNVLGNSELFLVSPDILWLGPL